MKEFADDNFKFDENGRKLSKRVENTVGKGEIARNELFLQYFQKTCFPTQFRVYNSIPSFIYILKTKWKGEKRLLTCMFPQTVPILSRSSSIVCKYFQLLLILKFLFNNELQGKGKVINHLFPIYFFFFCIARNGARAKGVLS